MDPLSLVSHGPLPQIWPFPAGSASVLGDQTGSRVARFEQSSGLPEMANRDLSVDESTVTEQSGGSRCRRRRRRDLAAVSEDESSKLVSTSSGNDLNDCEIKRVKVLGTRDENGDSKAEVEASSGIHNKLTDPNAQPSEASKQDFIHVRARRGQATDSHSLAERARREKISERMKMLQDLVPGCNKVIGKALVLDEIINYIQSLQRQVEFLSMKLEAVNSRVNSAIEGIPHKDYGAQTFDTAPGLAFGSQSTKDYGQGSVPEWLHMQVGGAYERVT